MPSGKAHIEYEDVLAAQKALRLSQSLLLDRPVRVRKCFAGQMEPFCSVVRSSLGLKSMCHIMSVSKVAMHMQKRPWSWLVQHAWMSPSWIPCACRCVRSWRVPIEEVFEGDRSGDWVQRRATPCMAAWRRRVQGVGMCNA